MKNMDPRGSKCVVTYLVAHVAVLGALGQPGKVGEGEASQVDPLTLRPQVEEEWEAAQHVIAAAAPGD